MAKDIREILEEVKNGKIEISEAEKLLKLQPFEDLSYAKIDLHRVARTGRAEVIYGESKTADQIAGITRELIDAGQEPILITRIDAEKAKLVAQQVDIQYFDEAKIAVAGSPREPDGLGTILVIAAGTSDIPVAKEAVVTARTLGNEVREIYDVGVAGIHRLLAHVDSIMEAKVVIAIAGMEGALASVVGGLTGAPVIAVPTSVGYGAAFDGLAALLSMINSCASGVCTVNIDNGFGAGFLADRINHMTSR